MAHQVVRVHVGSSTVTSAAAASPSDTGVAISDALVALAMPPLQLPSRQRGSSHSGSGAAEASESAAAGPLRRALSRSDVAAPAALPGTGAAGRASPSLSTQTQRAWENQPHGSPSSSRGGAGPRLSAADLSNRRGRSMELDSVAVSPVLKSAGFAALPPIDPLAASSRRRADSHTADLAARRKSHSARSTATREVIQQLRSRTMTLPSPLTVSASGPDESITIVPVPVLPRTPLPAAHDAASPSGSEDSPPTAQLPQQHQQPQDSIHARTTDGSEESLSNNDDDSDSNDSPRHAHAAAPKTAALPLARSLTQQQDDFASPRSLAFSTSGAVVSIASDVVPQKIVLVPPRRSGQLETASVLRPGLPTPRFPPFPYNASSAAAALKRDEALSSTLPPVRNVDVFEGRNRFVRVPWTHCTLVLGPGWPAAVIVGLLIALCTVLFVSLPANDLRRSTHRQLDGSVSGEEYAGASILGLFAMILGLLLGVACEIALLFVSATDPGILPRLRLRFESEASTTKTTPGESRQAAHAAMTRAAKVRQSHSHRPRLLTVGPSGSSGSSGSLQGGNGGSGSGSGSSFPADLKWCDSCEIHRPLRAVHCNVCHNCVMKFDHRQFATERNNSTLTRSRGAPSDFVASASFVFVCACTDCPWLGTCVGARNYRSFHWFLWTLSAQILLILVVCSLHLRLQTLILREENAAAVESETVSASLRRAMAASPVSLVLPCIALLAGCFVLPLLSLHLYLTSRNLTTNEWVKGVWAPLAASGAGVGGNPFDRGCRANWRSVLCGGQAAVESYLHLERIASLPPLLPRARPLKLKSAPAQSSAVASKYAASGDIESGLALATSPSLDADRPSEHGRVRFVDAFEMAELETRWMRRFKHSSVIATGQNRALHHEEDAVVFHVQAPSPASPPSSSPSPLQPQPQNAPHHRDHDSLLHLPGFAASSAAPSPAAKTIKTPTAAQPGSTSAAPGMVAYPSFAFPLMSLPSSPPPDAEQADDDDADTDDLEKRDEDLERGQGEQRDRTQDDEAGVQMTQIPAYNSNPTSAAATASTAAKWSPRTLAFAALQQQQQVQSASNLNASEQKQQSLQQRPPQQPPQQSQLQRGASFWSHNASMGGITVRASAVMSRSDAALDTEPENSEIDATRGGADRRSTASRLPPYVDRASSPDPQPLSPSLAPSLASSSRPVELRMLSSSPTPP